MSCGRAKLGAPLSSQPPELCPHTGIIPLQIIDCSLQLPIFPINSTLVALEYSLWEHRHVLSPCPSQSLRFSLPAGCFKSCVSFPQWGGWASATPGPGNPCPIWVTLGTFPLKDLILGLKVQPVLLKTATSLVLSKASSDLPHPCPCPHHHCGPVLCYPDGRPIE